MQAVISMAAGPQAAAAEGDPPTTEAEASAAARKSGKQVEVLGQRGQSRETYALPEGGFVTTEHMRPVRTFKAGQWVGIDTTLRRSDTDGTVSPVAGTVGLHLSGGGSSVPMISLLRAGRQLALTWPGALPTPVLEGDTAVYKAVMGPDVDLRVQAKVSGASFVLVVKTAEAAKDPRIAKLQFPLSAPGLNVSADAQGNQSAVDAASGAEVFRASTPMMWDSSQAAAPASTSTPTGALRATSSEAPGDAAKVAAMKVSVDGQQVTLEPDQNLLTDPTAKFPIYLDPHYYAPGEAASLMVSSGGWEKADFDEEGMGRCPISLPPAGAYCESSHVKRLFYRMPTSKFTGAKITSAEFSVKETFAPSCSTRAVRIYRTKGFARTSTWNSTSDNWSEHITSRDVAKGYTNCPAGDVIFNVQKAVEDASKYGWAYTSFGLRAYDESDEYGWKRFDGDAYLRVYYNHPPTQPVPKQLSSSPGGSCADQQWGTPVTINRLPMLYAKDLKDVDNGGVEGEKLTVEFELSWTDPDGKAQKRILADNSPSKGSGSSSFDVQVPGDLIQQNTLIGWAVRSSDGEVWSPWSWAGNATSCYFKYDPTSLPAPTITSNPADGYAEFKLDDQNSTPQNGVGRYGKFDLTFDARVTKYAYDVNKTPSSESAHDRSPGTTTESIYVMPTDSGVNTLYVTVWDVANNFTQGSYLFWVTEGSPAKAHWKFDDAAGAAQLADSGDHATGETGYPADMHGGVTLGAQGMVGTAMHLDGASGYADTASKVLDTSKSFSVSAWVQPSYFANNAFPTGIIATQAGVKKSGFELYYSASYKRWIFNKYQADTDTAQPIRAMSPAQQLLGAGAKRWHLVGVYDRDARKLRLYVNDKLAGEADYADADAWDASGKLQIGAGSYGAGPQNFFAGDVDDLKVYGRAVSAQEAHAMFTIKSQVVGQWHLNTTKAGAPKISGDTAPVDVKHDMALGAEAAVTNDETKALIIPPSESKGALDLNPNPPEGDGRGDDYASVDSLGLDTNESFTLAAWVQTPNTPTKSSNVLSLAGANNSAIAVRYQYDSTEELGRYVLDVFGKDEAGAGSAATLENQNFHLGSYDPWDHIAVVYDGFNGSIALYVNGRLESATNTNPGSSHPHVRPFSALASLQLGRVKTGPSSYSTGNNWPGQIDDVWILRGAASQEEIGYLQGVNEIPDI